jgi:surface antigen
MCPHVYQLDASSGKRASSMKRLLGIFTILAALSGSAIAQESAEMVQTSGVGKLKRASEFMIAPTGQNISVRLPATVTKGDVIPIQYEDSGNSVADSFMVTEITVRDGSCAIESKRQTPTGSTPSDMIYARPCKKLK